MGATGSFGDLWEQWEYLLQSVHYFAAADQTIIYPDPFPKILQVGRSEETDFTMSGPQESLENCGRGSFPVCPRDVIEDQPLLRIPQKLQETMDIIKTQLGTEET